MTDDLDLTGAFDGKTSQLNADDLARPLTGRITRVVCKRATKAKGEQPWEIYLDSWPLPWKPCLTMRRLLRDLWGGEAQDVRRYVGRSVTLYRAETRSPEGGTTQGVRVSHLSDISGPRDVQLLDGKGTRKTWHIEPLVIRDRRASLLARVAEVEAASSPEDIAKAREASGVTDPSAADEESLVKYGKALAGRAS